MTNLHEGLSTWFIEFDEYRKAQNSMYNDNQKAVKEGKLPRTN